jgi:hypothetical protein
MNNNQKTSKQAMEGSGGLKSNEKSQPKQVGSNNHTNGSIFDPNKYMIKLPKTKKVKLANGQIKFEQVETDYLPVAPRIA